MSDTQRKILLVFGTRPEAIKMAPVAKVFAASPEFEVKVCITGQHRHMLHQVLDVFGLKPDFDLNLMQPNQDLTDLTGRILTHVRDVLISYQPDWVFVHGDTTTALGTALAAHYRKTPVAHVEAGLRTSQRYSPFPEEMNRKLIGGLAQLHFAPTAWSRQNLLNEGIASENIAVTGNTVIDALARIRAALEEREDLRREAARKFAFLDPKKHLLLVTAHRRENFDGGIAEISHALRTLASRSDVQIVFPVHLNPNVQGPVRAILSDCQAVYLLEPLDYVSFVQLLGLSTLILTDSGGIQEEAVALHKPVLVLRQSSERPEAIAAGLAELVGGERAAILAAASRLLDDPALRARRAQVQNPYGDGHAAEKILAFFKTRTCEPDASRNLSPSTSASP